VYSPDSRFSKIDPLTGLSDSIAFASQTPWLMNATVRDNILFGDPFNAPRYNKVITACALYRDFETLEGGDLTEIGEKGINLSGGQKQRISLARAAYSTSAFVLLDDPLSAVDAPTARHLLNHCICGLLKDRTRVLVSHAVGLVLPKADYIVSMKMGEVVNQGTVDSLLNLDNASNILDTEMLSAIESIRSSTTDSCVMDSITSLDDSMNDDMDCSNGMTTDQVKNLIEVEGKATGAVNLGVYASYLQAAGGFVFSFIFMTSVAGALGMQVLDDWWLKKWTESQIVDSVFYVISQLIPAFSPLSSYLPNQITSDNTDYYIIVYGLIGLAVIFSENINFGIEIIGAYFASRQLHTNLLDRIMNAPLRFFDVTPSGKLIEQCLMKVGS